MRTNLMSIAILGLSATGLATVMGVINPPAAVQSFLSPKSNIQVAQAMGGGPLAKELQGKPVLVDIYATWCPGCQSIKPTLSTLKKEYSGKVNFVVFDVTNRKTSAASQANAQRLGLSEFFAANKSKTATVAIINPATGKTLKVYRSNSSLSDYQAVLNPAIASIR
jgi:thiol-disulfide isomerase/thioredoxin